MLYPLSLLSFLKSQHTFRALQTLCFNTLEHTSSPRWENHSMTDLTGFSSISQFSCHVSASQFAPRTSLNRSVSASASGFTKELLWCQTCVRRITTIEQYDVHGLHFFLARILNFLTWHFQECVQKFRFANT